MESVGVRNRLSADAAIAELASDGHVLTKIDVKEIYRDFELHPDGLSSDLKTRIGSGRFLTENKVRLSVGKYRNMLYFYERTLATEESFKLAYNQIDNSYNLRSSRRKESRALQAS